jgi:hypothetical protein
MALLDKQREQVRQLKPSTGDSLIPELHQAIAHPAAVLASASHRMMRQQGAKTLSALDQMPQLSYTLHQGSRRRGDRLPYQHAMFERRRKMGLVALQVTLGDKSRLDLLHDYMWATCEESSWVMPPVEDVDIELRVPATALSLAEICAALGDHIEAPVQTRVRQEIRRRLFDPYLADPEGYFWYRYPTNWNSVINSAIGATLLHLEQDVDDLPAALDIVLAGLDAFLETAFQPDGASDEGPGYWMYGLSNFICFAEMLRIRSGEAIDLLSLPRVQQIAGYPAAIMLSPGRYYAYSDSLERTGLEAGLVTRLARRSEETQLLGTLAGPESVSMGLGAFHTAWRNLLWWDGTFSEPPPLEDHWLKDSHLVRLVSHSVVGSVVAAVKGGDNGVSHSHNDAGSFVLDIGGETMLCDPGRGLYDLYRKHGRAANLFVSSLGHNLPCIDGRPQGEGSQFHGAITRVDVSSNPKVVCLDLEQAYDVKALSSFQRSLSLTQQQVLLEDHFVFDVATAVEEALVSWIEPELDGARAILHGQAYDAIIDIESPDAVSWRLERFDEASAANRKEGILQRLSFLIPPAKALQVRIRISFVQH